MKSSKNIGGVSERNCGIPSKIPAEILGDFPNGNRGETRDEFQMKSMHEPQVKSLEKSLQDLLRVFLVLVHLKNPSENFEGFLAGINGGFFPL